MEWIVRLNRKYTFACISCDGTWDRLSETTGVKIFAFLKPKTV